MNVRDPESLVQCPYEKVHMIRLKRMPYHLQKCRRNYKGQEFKVCPFNARHEVPEPEYQHHLINCPDKFIVEKDMIHIKRLQEDQNYRERYTGSSASLNSSQQSSNKNEGWTDCDDWEPQVDVKSSDHEVLHPENLDNLQESFNNALVLDERSIKLETNKGWFEDAYNEEQQNPFLEELSSPQLRRKQLLREKRQSNNQNASYLNEEPASANFSNDFQSQSGSAKPMTLPKTLQMIKAFGRGSPLNFDGEQDHETGDDFGWHFPKSLGRGTHTSAGLEAKAKNKTRYQSTMKQNVIRSLQNEVVKDDNFDGHPPQFQTENKSDSSSSFNHLDSPTMENERQLGWANFPTFQKGITPRYNSTFGADRPLSKQAQIQLAQQEQGGYYETGNWKRRERRGGGGRGFSLRLSPMEEDQGAFRERRDMAFGRGVGRGTTAWYP